MIPYAILSGTLFLSDHSTIDIRILDLSPEAITFRLSNSVGLADVSDIRELVLSFYSFSASDRKELHIHQFGSAASDSRANTETECECPLYLTIIAKKEFYTEYELRIDHKNYAAVSTLLMKEYLQYIHLKLEEDPSYLSLQLVQYPAAEEEVFPVSAAKWRNTMMQEAKSMYYQNIIDAANAYDHDTFSGVVPELAIDLHSYSLYHTFLSLDTDDFLQHYFQMYDIDWHPITKLPLHTVYLGNQNCFKCFPNQVLLPQLLKKVISSHLTPVLAFPPIKTCELPSVISILDLIIDTLSDLPETMLPVELVLNDLGMAELLHSSAAYRRFFSPICGILLNKRRKDTRMKWKKGIEDHPELIRENASNAPFYREYLYRTFHIQRYSYESCGYEFLPAPGKHILHLPFYQMNTSGHCTLAAICRNQNRSKQEPLIDCPGYCQTTAILYPTMLHMIGYQNSLFGFDARILGDPSYFHAICSSAITRIVLTLI